MRLTSGRRRSVGSRHEIDEQSSLPQSSLISAGVEVSLTSMTSTQLRDLEEGSMQDLYVLAHQQSQPLSETPSKASSSSPSERLITQTTTTTTKNKPSRTASTAAKTKTATATASTPGTSGALSPRTVTERQLSSPLPSAEKRIPEVTRQKSAGSLPPLPLASVSGEKELKFAPLPSSLVDRDGRPELKKTVSSATAADMSTSSEMGADDVVVMDKRTGRLIQPSQRRFPSTSDLGSDPNHYLHHKYYDDAHDSSRLFPWVSWRVYRILATTGVGLFAISVGVKGLIDSLSDEEERELNTTQPSETTDPVFEDFRVIPFLSSLTLVCSGILALGSFVIVSRLRKLASILQLSICCHLFFFLMSFRFDDEKRFFKFDSMCQLCFPLNIAGILLTVASYGYWCHEIQTEDMRQKISGRRGTKQTDEILGNEDDDSSVAGDDDMMRAGRKGLRRIRRHDSASVDSVDLEVGGPGGDCGGGEALAAADRSRRGNSTSLSGLLFPLGSTLPFDGSRRGRSRSTDLIKDDLVDGGVGDFDEAGSGIFSHPPSLVMPDQDIISSGEWEFMKAQIEERSRMQNAAVMAATRDGSRRNLPGLTDVSPVAMPTFGAGGMRSNRASGNNGIDDDDSMEAPQVDFYPSDDDDDSMAAPEPIRGNDVAGSHLQQRRSQHQQRDLSSYMAPAPSLPFSGSHYPEYSGMQLEVIKAILGDVATAISRAEAARPPKSQEARSDMVSEVPPISGEKSSNVQRQVTGTTQVSSDSDRTGVSPTVSDPAMNSSVTSVLTEDDGAPTNHGRGHRELSEEETTWSNNLSSKLLRGARLCRDDADAGLIRASEAANLVEEKIIPMHNRLSDTVFVKMHRGELHTIATDLRSPRRREIARQRGKVRPPHLMLS